jgi:predicted phage replisome organizer
VHIYYNVKTFSVNLAVNTRKVTLQKNIGGVDHMRERKYVKLRVDMYEDTKFKIIDMKPERDTIYYIWNRILLLAGKVNLEGELYLSKSMPYNIETLAIDFNRNITQIKFALDVFIELQMLELTEANVYKVKNFAKHQNIKVKEKDLSKNKETDANNIASALTEELKVESVNNKDTESEDEPLENRESFSDASKELNLEVVNKASTTDDSIAGSNNVVKLQTDGTILLDTKKSRNKNRKNKDISINVTSEEILEEDAITEEANGFTDGYITLDKDESVILEWSFG